YYDQSKLEEGAADEVFNALKLRNNLYAQKKYQRNLDWAKTDRELSTLKNVVIIWGRQDKYYPYEMAETYSERIPDSKLYSIEHASHVPHEERPEEVNNIIDENTPS